MELEKILRGIMSYIDTNILPGMNDVQQFGYLSMCEVLKEDISPVKTLLEKNIFARVLLSADKEGNVNIDRVATAARKAIEKKGKISFKIPGFGSFTLNVTDVDDILRTVMEE